MKHYKINCTDSKYCQSKLGEKRKRVAVPVNQLHLVFDIDHEDSLKAETYEARGNAVHFSVKDLAPIDSDFKKFLRYNDSRNVFADC